MAREARVGDAGVGEDEETAVLDDLDKGASDLTTGAEVVLVIEEGGDVLHFCGEGGSDLQFAKNQCGGFGTAPRCKGDVGE